MKIKPSIKVTGERYVYHTDSKLRFAINPYQALAIVNHKKRFCLALVENTWGKENGNYRTNQKMSYTDALRLMAFIAKYINMVKPTEATILAASTKAHCKGIARDQDKMLANVFNLITPSEIERGKD